MTDQMEPVRDREPAWLKGRGSGPVMKWSIPTPGYTGCLAYAREAGDLFVAQSDRQFARYDFRGQLRALTPLPQVPIALAWSDDGSRGAAVLGERSILRLDRDLRTVHELTVPDVCLSLAVSPFGNHLAVSLADGTTVIYDASHRRIATFETLRPLGFLKFCINEPILFGAAEHGLVCCHNLAGALIWQQTNWSNVGSMSVTAAGDLISLASFSHGIQALDGDGASLGSYVLDGTVCHVESSCAPLRLVASTIERSLFWLNASGDLQWSTTVPHEVVDLVCDPLGHWALCWLAKDGIYRLDWPEETISGKSVQGSEKAGRG